MRSTLIAITAVVAALASAGCQRDHSDLAVEPPLASETSPAPAEAMAPTPALPTDASPSADGTMTTMRYTCDDGHTVEIVDTETARVMLADGRSVDIMRTTGSAPPMYSGEALQFSVGSQGGTLSQDGIGSFDCRAAS